MAEVSENATFQAIRRGLKLEHRFEESPDRHNCRLCGSLVITDVSPIFDARIGVTVSYTGPGIHHLAFVIFAPSAVA